MLTVLMGDFGGLWLALLGFFLLSAAETELQLVNARAALGGLRVGDIMVRDPISVPVDLPLDRFFDDVFLAHRHTAHPVVDDGPVGLVSFRDALDVPRDQWPHLRVADRMLPLEQVLVVDADRDLADVVDDLVQDPMHRALVRREGELAGLLSVTDAAPARRAASEDPAPLAVGRG